MEDECRKMAAVEFWCDLDVNFDAVKAKLNKNQNEQSRK
jgi:hypothetical protein